jgi:hypothetical protein
LGGKSGFCTEKSGFNAEKCLFFCGTRGFCAEEVGFMPEKVFLARKK